MSLAVIWIDWYSYHISRLRALSENSVLKGNVTGIELVGGCGVHAGLKFRDEDRAGLPIRSLFPEADWKNAGQLKLAMATWQELQRLRPSAVLVPGYYTLPGIAAALWARLHGRRSILMSETTEADHQRVWWKELIKRAVVRTLFDSGICGGAPHVRYLEQLGFARENIAGCYDVVDNGFYQGAADEARRSQPPASLPDRYFLYVGRLAPEKNLMCLLDAFAAYRRSGGCWSLVMVGAGPDMDSLQQQAVRLGISEAVQFPGLKNTRETTRFYAFAGCFILPSVREPWGLVVNEAMASGLPVLVSRHCGCAEDLVADGGNGFTFDPNDPAEMTRLMAKLSSLDQLRLAAMSNASREIISGYSPRHWASEVARLLQ